MAAEKENEWKFREYYVELRKTLEENVLEEFGKLNSDEDRIRFVSEKIPFERQPIPKTFSDGKDETNARALRESGNKAFGKSNYKEALRCYSESATISPQNEGTHDLALTIANRSAVLYHLQEYQLAVGDIDLALTLNYPKDLRYKVLERKAKCLLALKRHKEALEEFRNTITALDDSKLSSEKRMKMQKDIQIMLGIMTKPTLSSGHLNMFVPGSDSASTSKPEQPGATLSCAKHKTYVAACEKVEIREEPTVGRFACAAEDIAAGETILTEKAFCSVLLGEYSKTNCQHCFKRTIVPYPCDKCSFVVFCSLKCKQLSAESYHKYECSIFKNLHQSGVSVTVLMALRILSQKNLQHFLDLKDKLEVRKEEGKPYASSDYLNVYRLVRHENVRKREDFFERSVMALYLLRCLIKANYFDESDKEERRELSPNEIYIGGLVLRHLQLLQFNAHEISQLEMKKEKDLTDSKSVFIGGGLFATLALFNHSCDPGIVRYFEGTKVVVRTVKPIKKGEMIAENYGPIYSQMKKKERQEKLETQYWFKCSCIPCQEIWPTFEEIDKNVLRFRCDARTDSGEKFNNCNNVLSIPTNGDDFMIKCFICGQFTNLLKGLKLLQETDAKYQIASRELKKGNFQSALKTYLEILSTLHEILAPPFHDYLLCQQSIRKCMLTFGNKYSAMLNFDENSI